jgi:VanZ family protein
MKTIIFFLLSLATLGCVTFIPQYSESDQQILSNANFSSGLEHWQLRKKGADTVIVRDEELAMHSSDAKTSVSLYQTIPNRFSGKKLRVKALLRTNDVVSGIKPHYRARLLLVQYFGDKAAYTLPHQVIALEGTNDWQEVSEVFTISADCTEFRIVVQMSHCSGDFFLKDLSLYQVTAPPLYTWIKWLFRGAWVLFSFFLFTPYLKNQQLEVSKSLLLITVAAIFIGTTMPAEVKFNLKERIDNQLTTQMNKMGTAHPATPDTRTQTWWQQLSGEKTDITKVAHFTLFAFLVILLRRNNPSKPAGLLLVDILMLAFATELSQFFIEHRSPLITDVLIDMAGGGHRVATSKALPLISTTPYY